MNLPSSNSSGKTGDATMPDDHPCPRCRGKTLNTETRREMQAALDGDRDGEVFDSVEYFIKSWNS